MFLTIQTLFDDANIVSAIIRRVNQTRKDTIYWQQLSLIHISEPTRH